MMSEYKFNKVQNSKEELEKLNLNKVKFKISDSKFIKNQNGPKELRDLLKTKYKEELWLSNLDNH